MYEVKQSSSPYLVSKMQVFRSIFRDDYTKVNIRASSEKGVEGGAASFSIQRALKAAFGENMERTSLYLNSGNFSSDEVLSYNFADDKYDKIPLERILLCPNSPIFNGKDMYFNDTCGVASHTSSFKAMEAGFLEFIERQSFIYNWLTKSKGEKIDTASFVDSRTINLINKVTNYLDNIYAFNISLTSNVFVILCIGIGEKHVGIGLCAKWQAEDAFCGAMEELYQFFGLQKNKYEIKLTTSNSMGDLIGANIDEDDPQYYLKSFIRKFGKSKLLEEYSYLFTSPFLKGFNKANPNNTKDLTRIIKKVSNELEIDIKMTFIPSKIKNTPIKIVKFLTDNGFPHMKTEIIDTKQVSLLNGKLIPNKGRLLPFP